MLDHKPLHVLPTDFQQNWQAQLHRAKPTDAGAFRLINIRRTAGGYEDQRLVVLVLDENGFPIPGVKVAFAYSTAGRYLAGTDFKWSPPSPFRADIFPTEGSGQIEHIQNGAVKQGEPGGITVYVVEPEYSSDSVSGMGMLADHTGVHLTFQLRRTGATSLFEQLESIEQRTEKMNARLKRLEGGKSEGLQ